MKNYPIAKSRRIRSCLLYTSEAAKAINLPTLLIFGELDKMVNLEVGKKFSNLLENSKTHVINGCGHMIMIEKAFEMREKILKFLNS